MRARRAWTCRASFEIADLDKKTFDLAVHLSDTSPDTPLIGRKLGEVPWVLCASPAYLARHGTPQAPADLARHNCFTYANVSQPGVWRFVDEAGREQTVSIAGNVHANNGDMLCAMAVDGAGIVNEPDFIVGPDVRAGRLVRLLPGWQGLRADIWAVYPSRRHLSAKVRAFVDFLAEYFAGAGDWSFDAARVAVPAAAAPSAAGEARRKPAAKSPRRSR